MKQLIYKLWDRICSDRSNYCSYRSRFRFASCGTFFGIIYKQNRKTGKNLFLFLLLFETIISKNRKFSNLYFASFKNFTNQEGTTDRRKSIESRAGKNKVSILLLLEDYIFANIKAYMLTYKINTCL